MSAFLLISTNQFYFPLFISIVSIETKYKKTKVFERVQINKLQMLTKPTYLNKNLTDGQISFISRREKKKCILGKS